MFYPVCYISMEKFYYNKSFIFLVVVREIINTFFSQTPLLQLSHFLKPLSPFFAYNGDNYNTLLDLICFL